MITNQICSSLEKFEYKYSKINNSIRINLDYKQVVIIEIIGEKILINDELTSWNPLTGLVNMSLKKSLSYNTVGLILIYVFVLLINLSNEVNLLFTLFPSIIFSTWIIIWSIYYLVKLEFFKIFIKKIVLDEKK